MSNINAQSATAKLQDALRTFQAAFAEVDSKWTDVARHDFEETYLEPIEPRVQKMIAAIDRFSSVVTAAEHQCGSTYGINDI